jgi:hypothetical protein
MLHCLLSLVLHC